VQNLVREYLQKEVLLIAMMFLAKRQTSTYGSLGSFILVMHVSYASF
jgi:hypothetical protein